MPNGGHISCEYCINNDRGACQIFGVATGPFVLCRSFRTEPGMSYEDSVQQWPMLASLAPGAVYAIDNSSFSAGDPQPIFGLRHVDPHPIPDSYWAIPGRLLAGEYPGAPDDGNARRKLRRLLAEGISYFLDLTEETEPLKSYAHLLAEEAAGLGVAAEHHRMPIRDQDTPAKPAMKANPGRHR